MTRAVFRETAQPRPCAVCGALFTPKGPLQRVCRQLDDEGRLTPCATTARDIRWRRANLAPEKAAKYGMTTEGMQTRLNALLERVHDRAAFEAPAQPSRPRRVSLEGASIVGKTDAREDIYQLADGTETIGWPCPICRGPSDRRGACIKVACQREARKKANRDWCQANKPHHVAKVVSAKKRRKAAAVAAEPEPIPPSGERAKPDPWAAPPPAWEGPLPGAVLPIDVDLPVGRSETLGTALHAILTRLLRHGRGHDSTRPEWSLLLVGEQTSSGWAVWLPDEADVAAVRGKTFEARLRRQDCRITIGARAALRLKAPRVEQTTRHRVRLTTITPICMRALGVHGRQYRSYPQTPTLWSALGTVAARIGLAVPDLTVIGIVRVSHATTPERVTLNQGRGLVATCWSGDVVVDVNPIGRWLLEVAARIGFGGRTAYGLGRIVVRDEAVEGDSPVPSPESWEVVIDQAAQKLGTQMGLGGDEARAAVMGLVETATFERTTTNGCEVWRSQDVLLVAQPTTLRILRVLDVIFDSVAPPTLIEDHAVDRFIERVLGEGTCSREVAFRELVARVALSRPLSPYQGAMSATVPDAMLWVGPRTGDRKSARLRFVVGTKPGAAAPSVLTVLPLFDAIERDAA